VGVDINPDVVDIINQEKIHVTEPELDKVVKYVIEGGTLKATFYTCSYSFQAKS
jgi:UDP-N-acetyl-D-mannosaminuronic acid dehydrogenase